jgi:prepilin-type N-terminal cleavage/methylation domain-containing protein
MYFKKNKYGRDISLASGFTLLEMIVAMAIFSAVILLGLAALLSMVNAQRKAAALQDTQDNIRFAFEAMTKEIRTGGSYHCNQDNSDPISTSPQDCFPLGGKSFTFINEPAKQTVTYQIVDSQLVKSTNGTNPCDGIPVEDPDDCKRITAKDIVIIDRLFFYVDGTFRTFEGDNNQSRVTIIMEAQTPSYESPTGARLNLQTTVSPSRLDR